MPTVLPAPSQRFDQGGRNIALPHLPVDVLHQPATQNIVPTVVKRLQLVLVSLSAMGKTGNDRAEARVDSAQGREPSQMCGVVFAHRYDGVFLLAHFLNLWELSTIIDEYLF